MLLEKAIQLATRAHQWQYRKDGITPYIEHPKKVYLLLKEAGVSDEDILCAAWLHDTIEDCGLTKEFLEKEFNKKVADIVYNLTRNVNDEEYKKRILDSGYAVKIVKLADVAHNYMSLHDKLPKITIKNKVDDCKAMYFSLAKDICPYFYDKMRQSLEPWLSTTSISEEKEE